jgi:hypothetical protein
MIYVLSRGILPIPAYNIVGRREELTLLLFNYTIEMLNTEGIFL